MLRSLLFVSKNSNSKGFTYLGLGFLIVLSSCNLYEGFADKESDAALLDAALIYINEQSYSLALEKFDEMSEEFLAGRKVRFYHASAYAGRCGLDFLELVTDFEDMGTDSLLLFLMKNYTGGTATDAVDCQAAQDLVEAIAADPVDREVNENLLMTTASFAHLGVLLSAIADTDNNDTVDTGFDAGACTTSPTDAQVQQIGRSFALIVTSLDQIAAEFDFLDDQVSDLTSACTILDTNFPSLDLCGNTAAADWDTAAELNAMRYMVREIDTVGVGLGACSGDVVACRCP